MAKDKNTDMEPTKYYLTEKIISEGFGGIIGEGSEAVERTVLPRIVETVGGISTTTRQEVIYLNKVCTGKPHFEGITFSQLKSLVNAKIVRLMKDQAKEFVKLRSEYLKSVSPEADIWD